MAVDDDLLARAVVWRDDDPDTTTRAELEDVVAAARAGDLDALADLADRFAGTLEFGTAGLRGRIGAGPNRMNRAVVIRAAAGLAAYLKAQGRARASSSGTTRGTAATTSRATPRRSSWQPAARRCCSPARCRRRCWPSRSATSARTRA